jgi:putative MATE family efflux protein
MSEAKSKPTIDMLGQDALTSKIIRFALPLMASGVVQQSFNSVDVAVVGKFVGAGALAAVGANMSVVSLIVNLFIGIAIGSNVVIANYIGQRDRAGVQRAVHTSMLFSVVIGILLFGVGLCVASPLLTLLGTPAEVLADATLYLRLLSIGFPALMVYNFASAILRSVGDTRRPFYWLVIGGVINICLNLIFVIFFGMGVEGVAIATVVANVVSAAGVVLILIRDRSELHLDLHSLQLHGSELGKILRIGVPAGLQGMVFALSNVFIQSGINSFGKEAMAGSAAALNFELYCYYVISSYAQAAVAFISQNYGAGQLAHCRRIFRRCMSLSVVSCLTLNVVIYLFRYGFVSLFTTQPEAMQFAALRIENVLIFQFIACSYEVAGASMRAIGYPMTPTVLTILGTCLLRVGWVVIGVAHDYSTLLAIYPITWVVTGTAVITAWIITSRRALTPAS